MADQQQQQQQQQGEGQQAAADDQTQGEGQQQQQQAAAKDEGNVTDSHGQPGINKERHEKEVAELKKQIEDLKAEAADAAEAKAKRTEYEKKVTELEAKLADNDLTHSLELAGCIDVKSAKARLEDFGGDVAKLKEGCPHLFGSTQQKQKGSTGKPPAGTSDALDAKLDKAFGL